MTVQKQLALNVHNARAISNRRLKLLSCLVTLCSILGLFISSLSRGHVSLGISGWSSPTRKKRSLFWGTGQTSAETYSWNYDKAVLDTISKPRANKHVVWKSNDCYTVQSGVLAYYSNWQRRKIMILSSPVEVRRQPIQTTCLTHLLHHQIR